MAYIYLVRTAFASLFLFEFFNSIKILHFPLHFPWISLVLITLLGWIVWEKFIKKNADFPLLTGSMFLFQLYADTLGNLFKFYANFRWYDRFTHTTGGLTIGTVIFLLLDYFAKKQNWKMGRKTLIIFALSLSVSILVSYEFFEYFIDSRLHYFMITDRYDTDRDLLLGTIGAAAAILFFSSIAKRKSNLA